MGFVSEYGLLYLSGLPEAPSCRHQTIIPLNRPLNIRTIA